jgi:AcrR family transcriptional regulator
MSQKKGLRADAERNRLKVLEVARAVFATEGIAVPIDEIARRAGLGVGTLYRHFPTKEALFQAVVLRHMETMVTEARALATGKDAGKAFFAYLARIAEESGTKRDLIDALSGAGAEFGRALHAAKAEMREALGVLLARAQTAGVVRQDVDAVEVLSLIMATRAAMGHMPVDRGRSREHLFAIVCDGLRVTTRRATSGGAAAGPTRMRARTRASSARG